TDDAFTAGEHTTNYLDEELDPEEIDDAQEKWGPGDFDGGSEDEEVTEREFTVEVNGKRFEVNLEERGAPPIRASNGSGDTQQLGSAGPSDESSSEEASASTAEGEQITADMQGTILSVDVEAGDEVSAGDVLCVLEAMKM